MIVCRALAVFVFIYFAISAISVGHKVLTILRQVYDIQPYDHCMTCSIDGMTNFGAQLDCLLIHTKHTHTHMHMQRSLSLSLHTHTFGFRPKTRSHFTLVSHSPSLVAVSGGEPTSFAAPNKKTLNKLRSISKYFR